jgi:hypothetical protein
MQDDPTVECAVAAAVAVRTDRLTDRLRREIAVAEAAAVAV